MPPGCRDIRPNAMAAQRPDVPREFASALRSICLELPEAYEQSAWVGTRGCVRKKNFPHVLMISSGWPARLCTGRGRRRTALRADLSHDRSRVRSGEFPANSIFPTRLVAEYHRYEARSRHRLGQSRTTGDCELPGSCAEDSHCADGVNRSYFSPPAHNFSQPAFPRSRSVFVLLLLMSCTPG